MYQDLQGKIAVVTGSSSGLGREIAKRYYEEGMKLVLNYFSEKHQKETEELAEKMNSKEKRAIVIQADISSEEGTKKLTDAALDNFGDLDIWVNNAGIQISTPTHEVTLEDWNKQIGINLTGVFLGSKAALRHFIQQKKNGNIINISSVHEKVPWPTFAAYTSSKGGVKLFTETIALEYASKGIRVNGIAPGAIETPINAEKFKKKAAREQIESMIPLDFIGKPKDVAACAAWLASSESSYVTGDTLFVDGGMQLYPSFEEGEG